MGIHFTDINIDTYARYYVQDTYTRKPEDVYDIVKAVQAIKINKQLRFQEVFSEYFQGQRTSHSIYWEQFVSSPTPVFSPTGNPNDGIINFKTY